MGVGVVWSKGQCARGAGVKCKIGSCQEEDIVQPRLKSFCVCDVHPRKGHWQSRVIRFLWWLQRDCTLWVRCPRLFSTSVLAKVDSCRWIEGELFTKQSTVPCIPYIWRQEQGLVRSAKMHKTLLLSPCEGSARAKLYQGHSIFFVIMLIRSGSNHL